MKLNRAEFLQAVKFLKTALSENQSRQSITCLYAEKKSNKCILTAANAFIIKRVTLDIIFGQDEFEKPDINFMIDQPALYGFESILNSQSGPEPVCEVCAEIEGDEPTFEFIEISETKLLSKRICIVYEQPECDYPDLDKLFYPEGKGCKEFALTPNFLKHVASDYPGREAIKVTVVDAKKAILIEQKHTGYQSLIMPVSLDNWPDREDIKNG